MDGLRACSPKGLATGPIALVLGTIERDQDWPAPTASGQAGATLRVPVVHPGSTEACVTGHQPEPVIADEVRVQVCRVKDLPHQSERSVGSRDPPRA